MRHVVSVIAVVATSVVLQSNAAAETYYVDENGDPVNDQQAYHLWVSGGAAAHTYTCEIESGDFVMGVWTPDHQFDPETLVAQYSGPPAYTYIGHHKDVTLAEPIFVKYRFRYRKNGDLQADIYKY